MNVRSTRVLQVLHGLGVGGAETWLMEVLRLWSTNGNAHMDFLLTGGTPGAFDDEARALGASTYYVPYRRGNLPAFIKTFRSLLREGCYDAIHDHQDYASGWHFMMAGEHAPRVRVTHVHNPAYQIRNNYGVSAARRMAASVGRALVRRHATHIAGTSRQVLSEYGFDDPKFAHIPRAALHCGFDPARFAGDGLAARAVIRQEFDWRDPTKLVLVAGRIDRSPDPTDPQTHKNSGFAAMVAIEAARLDPTVTVLFAGHRSSAVPVLEGWIRDAGFETRIRFAGIRHDIDRLMLASDALLFPSRGEGLGMVAVEAQAAGLPVLASTNVPREAMVVPELVEFKPLADGAKSWAERLLDLAGRRHVVADANERVAASPFAIRRSADALLRLYRDGVLP